MTPPSLPPQAWGTLDLLERLDEILDALQDLAFWNMLRKQDLLSEARWIVGEIQSRVARGKGAKR